VASAGPGSAVTAVVVVPGPAGAWAWCGATVTPAQSLADTSAYLDVPEEQRRLTAIAQERAWLAAMWTPAEHMRFEVRYVSDPQSNQVSCALLGHVYRPSPAAADGAARALLERFTKAPRHVTAEPVADLQRTLVPFRPSGFAEIRKQVDWLPVAYRGSARSIYVSVRQFASTTTSWEPVWHELARLPSRTMLSVCLEPFDLTTHHQAQLRLLVAEYEQASAPKMANPLWGAHSPVADHSCLAALEAHRTALSRYRGQVYRIRISVVSEGVLPDRFTHLLAATVSPPAGQASGAVVRKPPPGELAAAWANVTGLDCAWLDETYRQGAQWLTEVERLLCNLVDVTEATSAFRLPYEIPGHLPVFTGRPVRNTVSFPGPDRADPAAPDFD
jgi:hypothetical protein